MTDRAAGVVLQAPVQVDTDYVDKVLQGWQRPRGRRPGTQNLERGGPKGVVTRWRKDRHGNWVPPALIDEFCDWYVDPARTDADTLSAWAEAHGVSQPTVSTWLRDQRVRAILDHRYSVLNAAPERVQQVVLAVFDRAVRSGDHKAAELYLRYVDRLQPKTTVVVHEDRRVADLSDAELRAELRRAADALAERERRALDAEVIDAEWEEVDPDAVDGS